MAIARMVHRGLFTSADLRDLPYWAEVLFVGMIVYSDNRGYIRDDVIFFQNTILNRNGARKCPNRSRIESVLKLMMSRNMLQLEHLEGVSWFKIRNFFKFQRLNRIEYNRIEDNTPLPPKGVLVVDLSKPKGSKLDEKPILEKWNALASKFSRPQISKIGPTREKKLAARLKEHPDFWSVVEKRFETLGQFASDGSWLTFDWILNPTNFLKLADGNFDRVRDKNSMESLTESFLKRYTENDHDQARRG